MNKPIYFSVVVWGERHCGYLLNYCVPSLLAPNNIPSLKLGQKNKFIICCPDEDWDYIDRHDAIEALKRYITVEHISLSPCSEDKNPCLHMGIGHKKISDWIYKDKVYGSFITPDQLFPDGSIAFLQATAEKGYEVILTPAAVRTRTDKLFPLIESYRNKHRGIVQSIEGPALVMKNNSDLVKLFWSTCIHDGWRSCEWGEHRYGDFPWSVFWPIYDDTDNFKGILNYTLSWAISLADYSAVYSHDNSMLDTESFDASYIFQNFRDNQKIYFVTTAQEFISASFSEKQEYSYPILAEKKPKWVVLLRRMYVISLAFHSSIFDDFKRRHFKKAIIYTCDNQTDSFIAMQKKADRMLSVATSRFFHVFASLYRLMGRARSWQRSIQNMIKVFLISRFPLLEGVRNRIRDKARER